MPRPVNRHVSRMLRWYLPIWIVLTVVTVALTVGEVSRPVAAGLWIALFLGTVAAIVLLVVADELADTAKVHVLPPDEVDTPINLTADVLPPARSKPLSILRQPS